ncbi:LytR family transcriptional regulator [Actinomadura darangshiensis]|uniref:LytR family transcriptional regulator n=1 Tax=Actinomadura darangshiensis TaxID=705336 RepID=A0A4R4ZYD1_9ACTN|nr:LCP family protein [Actinomadura darangshiensis]TDD64271.1 LytR family transcriptional regulator [Actinomadura darangshiensis]
MTVDELDLLRDLGRGLEHEPPPSLVRQRNRLLDAGRARRRRGPGRWTLLGVVAMVTAAAILVPAALLHGRDAKPVAAKSTAPAAGKALNVLVIGSDARGSDAARSDTLMLVHVPADRKRPHVVSLPRDLLVRIPACGRAASVDGMINSAFTAGGASCTLATVRQLSGVRVDQTVVIDFGGFRTMVDALGGVEVTLPKSVSDQKSGLDLSAGRHWVDGRQALAYARVRHGLGDGSDLDRIKRQHRLLGSLARQARKQMTNDPVAFARFLAVAAGSVKTVPRLDAGALKTLVRGFEDGDSVAFDTVPVRPAPSDPSRVVLDEPAAKRMFASFRSS